MIDNNNQYAEYSNKDLRDKWDASWQWLWDNDIRPTIESLRQVAREAVSRGHKKGSCLMGIGLCKLCDALDAVPAWCLDSAEESE